MIRRLQLLIRNEISLIRRKNIGLPDDWEVGRKGIPNLPPRWPGHKMMSCKGVRHRCLWTKKSENLHPTSMEWTDRQDKFQNIFLSSACNLSISTHKYGRGFGGKPFHEIQQQDTHDLAEYRPILGHIATYFILEQEILLSHLSFIHITHARKHKHLPQSHTHTNPHTNTHTPKYKQHRLPHKPTPTQNRRQPLSVLFLLFKKFFNIGWHFLAKALWEKIL